MNRIVVKSQIGCHGILQLTLPVGPAGVQQEGQITVDPVGRATLSSDEWHRCILEIAGKWQAEFGWPAQGEYEHREL